MNTLSQNNPIRQYLLTKKLPWDIMLEVEDHIHTQVQDLEISKNLTYEEAFFRSSVIVERRLENRSSCIHNLQ